MNKKQIDLIFAKAKVEVWKERLRDGECSYGEAIRNLNEGGTN